MLRGETELRLFGFNRGGLSRRELFRRGVRSVGSDVSVSRMTQLHGFSGTIGDGARIDDFCVITGNVEIGARVHISPFVFLGGSGGCIRLMSDSGVGSHSSLFTKTQIYDLEVPRNERDYGDIEIGANSILGRNVTVLPGVTIGPWCVIGSGCIIRISVGERVNLVSYGARLLVRDSRE